MGEQITSGSLDRSGPGRVVGGGQNWELETRAHNFRLPTRVEKSISIYSIDRQEIETGEKGFLEKEKISIAVVSSVGANRLAVGTPPAESATKKPACHRHERHRPCFLLR